MSSNAIRRELLRQLARQFGLHPADLASATVVPTVADYLPRVIAAATAPNLTSYRCHWERAVEDLGHRRVDEVRPSDIVALQRHATRGARRNTATRDGRCAGEACVRAMRNFYKLAVGDGLVDRDNDPAAAVPLPRRLPSPRHALQLDELGAINDVVASGGKDVPLDCLLMRLHTETACRRGGALGLRVQDLDTQSCLIRLREKGGTVRWQPITPTLVSALREHARLRGARRPSDALLRYRNGSPLTRSRYDLLWRRIRRALPWAKTRGVSMHWIRHTIITWVERRHGYGVARAYAGHTDSRGASTTTYIKARHREVALALSELTGEPHPLAAPQRQRSRRPASPRRGGTPSGTRRPGSRTTPANATHRPQPGQRSHRVDAHHQTPSGWDTTALAAGNGSADRRRRSGPAGTTDSAGPGTGRG